MIRSQLGSVSFVLSKRSSLVVCPSVGSNMDSAQLPAIITETLTEALSKALSDGGSIHTFIMDSIAAGIAAALSDNGAIHQAIEKEHNRRSLSATGDFVYPFRQILRGMSPSEFQNAWQSLVADPDQLQALMDSSTTTMIDPLAAPRSPQDRELRAALKLTIALKRAQRYSWKALCLPEEGGGSDVLLVFLGERSQGGDEHTRALACSLLSLVHLIDNRFTKQRNNWWCPRKVERRTIKRKDMMLLVYQTIKAYKMRTCQNSASSHFDTEILLKDHGVDIMLAQAAMLCSQPVSLKRGLAVGSDYIAPPKVARLPRSPCVSLPG